MFLVAISFEFRRRENPVVAMIVEDVGTSELVEPLFKTEFRIECVACTERHLICDVDGAGGSIVEDCSPMETIAVGFASKTRVAATGSGANILIHRDKIAWLIVVCG